MRVTTTSYHLKGNSRQRRIARRSFIAAFKRNSGRKFVHARLSATGGLGVLFIFSLP